MPRKPSKRPFAKPRKICPFSGKKLEVVELSTGDWQVRGQGWVSTRLFQTEEQAYYYFSHNEGLPPDYKTRQQRIEVKHKAEFSEAKEDSISADIDSALSTGEKMAEALTK